MSGYQVGIFGLGTSQHWYLEFDARPDVPASETVRLVAALEEPRGSLGGVNLVLGLRPELWASVTADDPGVSGFNSPVRGPDVEMPATQHDAFVWIAGSARDLVFDMAHSVVDDLRPVASLASRESGWAYKHNRDLTGFIDGTENPGQADAPELAVIPDGKPGAGGSVLLLQKWAHDHDAWQSLSAADQELVIGRTKPDSVELDETLMPDDAHVPRTTIEGSDGTELKIFRRNAPYGDPADYGTMFVGFSQDQQRLSRMLDRMAGVEDGVSDALTKYAHAVSGAYYFVPSVDALRSIAQG